MAWAMPYSAQHAAGQRLHLGVGLGGETHPIDRALYGVGYRGFGHFLEPGHVRDELADSEPRVEAELLRQIPQFATHLAQVGTAVHLRAEQRQ